MLYLCHYHQDGEPQPSWIVIIRAESAEHAIAKIKDHYGKVVVSVNRFRPEGRYQQHLWPI